MSSPLPILPTTVIGSYSMPEWLERAKNEYLSRRLSRRDLDEMHDAVRKAAIKDQEAAGIDVVSDGEAQRDNMIDYFTERMPGVQVDQGSKRFYYDFYQSVVRSKLATGTLGLSEEAKFLSRFSDHVSKISISGPHTLVKRIQNKHYPTEEAFAFDIARVLNLEMKELVRAGATHLQIDEPYYSGFPEDLPWALTSINEMVNGVNAHVTLHICYGNRYGKPSFEGSYEFLFPAIMDARVQAISMEFARRGEDDIKLFTTVPFQVGIGVIDVKTNEVESAAFVADRIRRALEVIPAERLIITPDCGLVRLPRDVAFAKLNAMVEGTRIVRKELGKEVRPLAERVTSGQFVYMTELVASGLKREAQVLEIASKLAMIPEIAGGSITSYAGGALGQDSIRVGTAVRARGLVPNVHQTCVGQDRKTIDKILTQLAALEMHNIFAISGDWPKAAMRTAVFDIDSVQLAAHIAELRARTGTPFFISCAVSPFKYQREDLLYQYLKLEKKIAAGADMAITQVGWDATKFVELKRYLDERGIKTPVLGNVFVLSRRAAERMNTGNPPGCWASDDLVAVLKKESEAPDGGLQGRLERAARSIAILKGIGYAGAYIGGTHDASQIRWMIRRAEELAPKWEELFEELQFGRKDGFYLYGRDPQPKPTRTFLPTVMDAAAKALPFVPWSKSTKESAVKRAIAGAFSWLDRHPRLSHWFERFEYYGKKEVFGCQNCGNCVLGSMEYVCPQTCPKQMRNGPCGGTFHGECEVIGQQCIWVKVMARAEASNTIDQLKVYIPPPDRTLTGTASWVNFYLGRDSRPGRPKDLWQSGGPGRTVPVEEDERLKTAEPSAADKALAARTPPKPAPKSAASGTSGKVEKVSA